MKKSSGKGRGGRRLAPGGRRRAIAALGKGVAHGHRAGPAELAVLTRGGLVAPMAVARASATVPAVLSRIAIMLFPSPVGLPCGRAIALVAVAARGVSIVIGPVGRLPARAAHGQTFET